MNVIYRRYAPVSYDDGDGRVDTFPSVSGQPYKTRNMRMETIVGVLLDKCNYRPKIDILAVVGKRSEIDVLWSRIKGRYRDIYKPRIVDTADKSPDSIVVFWDTSLCVYVTSAPVFQKHFDDTVSENGDDSFVVHKLLEPYR